MAIRSDHILPGKFVGKGWDATLLNAPGTRAGMKCIYKIMMNGDTKRAGLYVQSHSGGTVTLNVGGNLFFVNTDTNEISYSAKITSKYSKLLTDEVFMDMVNLTLAHFGIIDAPNGVYKRAAPKLMTLTEEEAAAIEGFGIF